MPDEYSSPEDQSADRRAECASVKKWLARVKKAREKWAADFERIQDNIRFAAGLQWECQKNLNDPRYTANQVNPQVNQKVSSLYARDPKAECVRRKRLDFQIWDGRLESIEMAKMLQMQNPADPVVAALLADFSAGRQHRDMVERVGKTLEIVYKWQLDNMQPSFKLQIKQLVRRVVTCGVGYVKLSFSRRYESQLTTSGMDSGVQSQALAAEAAAEELLEEGETEENIDKLEQARMLQNSLQASAADGELTDVDERLVLEFPPVKSIIPDPNCSALKGFLGARWIAQQYILDIDTVNTFFGKDIVEEAGGELVTYDETGQANQPGASATQQEDAITDRLVCVFELFDTTTKSHFYVCDGYKYYLKAPEPLSPRTKRFWPIFSLTFNDIEADPGDERVTIFPPSDVQLIKSAQMEWNRTRESLRQHRRANAPKHITGKGWLTDEDKELLASVPENAIIELQGLPPGTDVSNALAPFKHTPIDPLIYDTTPLVQDIRVTLGNQEGTVPASSKSTATAATINEQQRITTTASNVDDLDDLLSEIAEAGSEILLRELQETTVKRIAGPGALWPEPADKQDFINEIYLVTVAASSGRPNKALEISNFQQIAPLLLQAGASPHFIIREGIKRLDDRLDPDDAFPSGPPGGAIPMTPAAPMSGGTAPTPQNQNPPGYIKPVNPERPVNAPTPSQNAA